MSTLFANKYRKEIQECKFTSGAGRQKNKKEAVSRCDLGVSIECELLCKHSTRSDYWHRCYLLLFLFFVRYLVNYYFAAVVSVAFSVDVEDVLFRDNCAQSFWSTSLL